MVYTIKEAKSVFNSGSFDIKEYLKDPLDIREKMINLNKYYTISKTYNKILYESDEYDITYRQSKNYVAMGYNNILMIDIDGDIDFSQFLEDEENSFMIYQSTNGYHVFLVSEWTDFNDPEKLYIDKMVKYKGSDLKYILFTMFRNKSYVRLSNYGNTKGETYKYMFTCGKGVPNDKIVELVKKHHTLTVAYIDYKSTDSFEENLSYGNIKIKDKYKYYITSGYNMDMKF